VSSENPVQSMLMFLPLHCSSTLGQDAYWTSNGSSISGKVGTPLCSRKALAGSISLIVLWLSQSSYALGRWISKVLPFPGVLLTDTRPPMADLLIRLHNQNVSVDYIEKLLAAFRDDEQVVVSEVSENRIASASPLSPQPLAEPLTNREIDILELLEQRLQTKEIAEKMFISPETVKSHLKNIYQKLDVRNRRQAVERAVELGILTRR